MDKNHLIIDINALRHNYNLIRSLTPARTKIICVVKANAYGHGLVQAAKALEACGADAFGIFDIKEAVALRKAKIREPIMALSGIWPGQAKQAATNDVTVAVYSLDAARELSRAFSNLGKTGNILIKMDTGMGRLGILPDALPDFLKEVSKLKAISVEGVISHLAASDDPKNPHTKKQLAAFDQSLKKIKKPLLSHIANSGAVFSGAGMDYSFVRPGIALYGSAPEPGMAGSEGLKPVMSFKTQVIFIKKVLAGSPISYGMTHITKKDSVIATIPVGYADGYSRSLSNKGRALVRGRRVPIVGTICMNLIMLDVTKIDGISLGDEVVLLGEQQGLLITAEEIAEKAGTISYEIYCSLGSANPKIYINGSTFGIGKKE